MVTDAPSIHKLRAALERMLANAMSLPLDPGIALDVRFVTKTIDEILGVAPLEVAEPKWCASLVSSAAEETYGPWDSRAEAIIGVTLIRDDGEFIDTHATIGRAETVCPVAHGRMSFDYVRETINDNAGAEPFCWTESDVFPAPEDSGPEELEFAAFLRRHLKSELWTMSDDGQERVELGARP